MKRHYLKIPPTLKSWYPGVPPEDWRRVVFEDATEKGTCVRILPLLSNHLGARASVYGDEFYFEVGRDKTRPDALFVTRIERNAGFRGPRAVPIPIEATFEPWPSGEAAGLDSVGYIFGLDEGPKNVSSEPADDEESDVPAEAAPLLLARLARAAAETRREWRPGTEPEQRESAEAFMSDLRRVWQRLRLGRYLSLTARQESLLRGMVRPGHLDGTERENLLSLFGLKGLNVLVTDPKVDLASVLTELHTLPLPLHVRSILWAAMLRGLPVSELRRELLHAAPGLSATANDPLSWSKWDSDVAPLLVASAQDASDGELIELLAATDDCSVIGRLAEWASALSLSDERAPTPAAGASETESGAAEPLGDIAAADVNRQNVDEWVIRFRGIDVTALAAMSADVVKNGAGLCLASDPLPSLPQLSEFASAVRDLNLLADALAAALPEASALEADHKKALAAYSEAVTLFGEGADTLILSPGLTPEQLIEVVELTKRCSAMSMLPEWVWHSDDAQLERPGPTDALSIARHLLDPLVRRNIRLTLEYLARLEEPSAVSWLTAPEPGRDVAEHLREWFDQVHEFLIQVPQDVRQTLRVHSASDFASAQEVAARTAHLARVVPADVTAAIEAELKSVASVAEHSAQLAAYSDAVDWAAANLPGIPVTFDILKSRVRLKRELPSVQSTALSTVRLEHNWTEATGSKATVALSRPDPTTNYGLIAVPLVLVSDRPLQVNVVMDWEVRDGLRSDWPAEWPESEPAGTIRIPIYAWRPQADQRTYHYSFKATFPVRASAVERRPRLEVVATVRNADDRSVIVPSTTVRWENVELNPPTIASVWRDETDPEYVRSHPVGLQRHADGLLSRLKSGSSIAAIAPRRFGKSTLVEYLVETGNAQGLCVIPTIHCTQHTPGGTIDYDRVWAWVSDRLQEKLGSGIPRELTGALPRDSAFDDARRAAKANGYSAIVLLFDEAQLLFPQRTGAQVGSDLKRLLQSNWSRRTPAMVPLQVGMIGLPSLPERAADLMGVLLPKSRTEMTEDELRPLIARMAPGLMTTRGARQRIAESSGNLLTLRVVLDRLAERANSEQRVWVSYDDVIAIQESLQHDLRLGREPGVALYVRDLLNSADSVDQWQPLPSYPTAVALADTRVPGTALQDAIGPAIERLNRWCQLYQPAEDTARRTYDEPRVREHLGSLRERGVLDDDGIASDLLEAWLSGVARRQAFDDSFRSALFAGAHRRIDKKGAPIIAAGAQAEIRVLDGVAYRIGKLSGDADRARFEMQSEMSQTLKRVVSNREPGADHIFDIIDMGLSIRDDNEAIQMYRWIDGEDLTRHLEAFSTDVVVDLGLKLARAVKLLHRNNILHRDIHPRNIVVDTKSDPESFRPVLIDFGFARFVSGSMHTRLGGEHLAPEVLRAAPDWTRAADIFSLGWTLEAVLTKGEKGPSPLLELLARMQDPQADHRPTAEDLVTQLSEISEGRQLEERRLSARVAIQRAASTDTSEPWFSPVLRDNYSKLVGIRMGFYRAGIEEYGAGAEFLNQVVEAYRVVRHLAPLRGQCHHLDLMQTLVALRARVFHAKDAHRADTVAVLSAFEALSIDQQKEVVAAMIDLVAGACRLKHLRAVMAVVIPSLGSVSNARVGT